MNSAQQIAVEIFAGLGALGVTGLTVGVAVYWLWQRSAENWIKHHFDKKLEDFRSSNTQDLERLRNDFSKDNERLKADINRLSDRASRFHAREYEVLPEVWGLLKRADGGVADAVVAMQELPNLNAMDSDELVEFLEVSDLKETQKAKLKGALNARRNDIYYSMHEWKLIARAQQLINEYQNYAILNDIFIEAELAEKLEDAARRFRTALITRKIHKESPTKGDLWIQAGKEYVETRPVIEEIRSTIKSRLADIRVRDE